MDAGADQPPVGGPLPRSPRVPAHAPVNAWRYWHLDPGGLLRSVSQRRFVWPPGRPLRASCVGGGHRPPAAGCGCGIYGAKDLATLRDHGLCLAPTPLVVGQVALWGAVIGDARGYRGEYAYPAALSLVRETALDEPVDELVGRLGAYGVAVGVTDVASAVGDVSAAVMAYQAMSLQAARATARSG